MKKTRIGENENSQKIGKKKIGKYEKKTEWS
jgi:hypothetical protein